MTEYTYDEAGNLLTETDALGNTVTYTYTAEGWLDTVTDAEGSVTRYTYDRTGSILSVDYAGEQTETHTYNEIGLLTTVTNAEGVTEYQYDDASRLISVTQPNGDTVSYTYDGHGNRLSMTYPDGKTVTYAYDEMDRLVSVTGVDDITTTYEYDALGRRTKTVGGKETTEYTYDEVGDLIAQTTAGSYNLDLSYTYDLSGRMTGESRTENGTTVDSSFTYDPLGQLTGFTRSDGITEGYTYDAAGNMLTKTQSGVKTEYTYNAANQLTQSVTSGNTTAYTYDANGNLTAKQTATGTTRYAYNALNLLQSYTGEDGYTETYTYNADRLLSSVTTPEATTNLTWDILYGDGVVISETTGKSTTDYTYGLDRISAITGSNRTEYIYDARGSVAAEVSYNNGWYTFGGTLGWKNVTSKSYTPFGEQIGVAVSGFGYNGEYYNAATGMVYLRARFYEPEMNRFSQKDLLRGNTISGTSLNRYLYCQNDPVNFIDPGGMSIRPISSAVQKLAAKVTASSVNRVTNAIKKSVNIAKKTTTTKIVRKPQTTTVLPTKNETSSIDSGGTAIKSVKTGVQQLNDYVKNTSSGGTSGDLAKSTSLNNVQLGRKKSTSKLLSVKPSVDSTTIAAKSCNGKSNEKKGFFSRLFSWPVDAFKDSARNGDQDDFLRIALGAERDKDNPDVYHIKQNYWQSIPIVGYNDLYDGGFKFGVGATGGSADRQKFSFTTADGTHYMLWLWKGDYINLGAGAEAGIYKKSIIPGHYLTSTENSMRMSMRITDHNTGEVIADYSPEEYQWWITSFNPQHQNVQSSDLDVTFVLDFSNLDESMWEAFSGKYADEERFNFLGDQRVEITWRG